MPVWKPNWEDEVPPLISEQALLAKLIAGATSLSYDVPFRWTPALDNRVNSCIIPKFWYQPRVDPPVDAQRGERYIEMDFTFQWITAPIIAIDYSFVCRRRCTCACHEKIFAKL
ncbi:hypothetical protein B0H11DRAFT_2244305 [Mycena galericulata]|nr:hypothetical protein B0H11DRAFT_2244305 [Mycena galericulata]